MRALDEFLQRKAVIGGTHIAGITALIAGSSGLGAFLTLLGALGWINGAFLKICKCPRAGKFDDKVYAGSRVWRRWKERKGNRGES